MYNNLYNIIHVYTHTVGGKNRAPLSAPDVGNPRAPPLT